MNMQNHKRNTIEIEKPNMVPTNLNGIPRIHYSDLINNIMQSTKVIIIVQKRGRHK